MPSAQRRFPPPWSVVPRELEVDWREGVAMREAVIVAIAGACCVFFYRQPLGNANSAQKLPDERATQIRGAYEAAREICDRRLAADRRCLNSISAKLLV